MLVSERTEAAESQLVSLIEPMGETYWSVCLRAQPGLNEITFEADQAKNLFPETARSTSCAVAALTWRGH